MRIVSLLAVIALSGSVARSQELIPPRDGAWLQNGIQLYRRMNEHESLSAKQTDEARAAATYVCAVVDLEKYLVFRAQLLKGAVAEATKRHRAGSKELRGIVPALPILIPLMDTRFFQDSPSCDTALLMVRDYLLKCPGMLTQDAEVIVESALLDAYSDANPP